MPKTKSGASAGGGGGSNWGVSGADWSETGTFVRKPTTGWLHKDHDMLDGSYIRYKLSYLGCVKITESMRSLQYQARTLATREAIILLAEYTDRIPPTKKRKVPRQISRLIGDIESHGVEEVNLCIDVDDLIIKRLNGMEILSHSLTAISFASGGEDLTKNFFGYVAKDPIYNRACHVFCCNDGTAQLVLATVGQAFELRYKKFLHSSGSQKQKIPQSTAAPVPASTPPSIEQHHSRQLGGRSGSQRHLPPLPPTPSQPPPTITDDYSEPGEPTPPQTLPKYMNQGPRRQLPAVPPPMFEVTNTVSRTPPTHSSSSFSHPPPPQFPPPTSSISSSTRPLPKTGLYSDLPGFPDPSSYEIEPEEKPAVTTIKGNTQRFTYNPYDTMPADQTLPFNLTLEEDDDNTAVQEVTYDIAEGIEDQRGHVQAPLPSSSPIMDNTYDVVEPDENPPPPSPPPPQESDYQLITIHQQPSVDRQEDQIDITPVPDEIDDNDEEDHIYNNTAVITSSPNYDDPISLSPVPIYNNHAPRHPPNPTPLINPTSAGEYDDPDIILSQYKPQGTDDIDGPPPSYGNLMQEDAAFDDSIYSTPHESEFPEPPEVDPFAPLSLQLYFHGCISRPDAESYVKEDGEFLVRESANKPGQFVLTGITNGKPQHLLLIDKSGRVKSKDREFESVPHLVKFFYDRATPLTIGNCEVYLSKPVVHN